jgi:hypothetical protein
MIDAGQGEYIQATQTVATKFCIFFQQTHEHLRN